jgi:hypothetical protein
MKIRWKILILIGAALGSTAALAASQGAALGGEPWWYGDVFWPNFLVFFIPMLLGFALVEVCNRVFLSDEGTAFARKCTWWAFGLRLGFLILVPILILLWGYPSNRNLKGLVEQDAVNAVDTAWNTAQSGNTLPAAFQRGPGDNTGGITMMGTAVFRLLSPTMKRTLLLGLIAAAVTSLTVIVVYRLGRGLFSPGVGKAAALIAAIYPEAVMIGSSHQQMGYITLIFSAALLAIAGLIRKAEPLSGDAGLPIRRDAGILLVTAVILGFLVSSQFAFLGVLCGVVFALWLSDPKKRLGRIAWIGAGVVVVALIILRILGWRDLIPVKWDFLYSQYRYLYSMAWDEFDKMVQAGGGDLFQNVLATMEKGPAFLLAAFYGLIRPSLPAAIGYHNTSAQGGFFWQLLNIYRGLGWYLILPLLVYGTIKSLRGLLARKPETVFMLLFWLVAFIGAYRAFGDEWDNPRYRLFILGPMVLLAAWAWMTQREQKDPWFLRIVIPFSAATVSLTVWYLLRDYANVSFPVPASIIAIAVITAAAFALSWLLLRPKKGAQAG